MELHPVHNHENAMWWWWYATAICCVTSISGALIFVLLYHTALSTSTAFLLMTAPCLIIVIGSVMTSMCVKKLTPFWPSRVIDRPLARSQQSLEQPLEQVLVQPLKKVPSLPSLNLKLDFSCPICFSIVADEVCIPCGHVFCEGCLNNLNGQCAICREEIYMTQKMYL